MPSKLLTADATARVRLAGREIAGIVRDAWRMPPEDMTGRRTKIFGVCVYLESIVKIANET